MIRRNIMNSRRYLAITCAAALAAAMVLGCSGCRKRDNSIPGWPWHDPDDPDPDWTEVTEDFGFVPSHIHVYEAPARLQRQNAVAYIAKVDAEKATFSVWGINDMLEGTDDALKTPKEVYDAEGKPAIVINGGFFYSDSGKNYSASVAVNNGALKSVNVNYASEDWITIYYPTRGVFVEHNNGNFEAAWTYYTSAGQHYMYQSPAANSWGNAPLAVPSDSFPEAASVFEAKNAIGGGPVLIKNSKIVNSYREELFDGESGIMCDTRHPRTAIGVTAAKELVLFVCEGRNMTEGVPGYTTAEVAQILLNFGCVEALNLDGGGSSCMLVNGRQTIKPSDGEQRKVANCVMIR